MSTETHDDDDPLEWAYTAELYAGGWSPLPALKRAASAKWVIDGVIPASSIVWVVGKPTNGKTFTVMSMAASVAAGVPWIGRQADRSTVIYLAAEGGDDIHHRRAAAEMALGESGNLLVVNARPRLDTPEGMAEVMSLVQAATGGERYPNGGSRGLTFDQVCEADDAVWDRTREFLQDDERRVLTAAERNLDRITYLEGRQAASSLPDAQAKELARLKALPARERDLEVAEEWARDIAARRLPQPLRSAYKFQGGVSDFEAWSPEGKQPLRRILLVIDSYSQTAADDDKASVSRYIKNLRTLDEQATAAGYLLTTIVLDHFNKSGESFMGALAKQGDSDVMIEVERHGQLLTMTCPEKMKTAKPFDPISLELAPFTIDGFTDGYGRPLTSLVIRDGERIAKLRKAAGTSSETAATIVLQLLADTGPNDQDTLRAAFTAHPTNVGKKADTVRRAFSRALEGLVDDEVVQVSDGLVSFSPV